MALTLSTVQVEEFTGATVADYHVDIAAELVHEQTGYTVDEHVDDRGIATSSVRAAWAMCAARVAKALSDDGDEAIISESQGDYSYSEDPATARAVRLGRITDGKPTELLQLSRAFWVHR